MITEKFYDFRMYWHNFKTGEYELIDTPADFSDYIPQDPAAQGLYSVYIQLGDKPLEAALKVLLACVGEKP